MQYGSRHWSDNLSEAKLKLLAALISLALVICVGVLGLMYFERWSFMQAIWTTIISLSTTGFGDIVPHTLAGRVFLMLLIVVGVGVVAYSLGAIVSITVETQINKIMERDVMKSKITPATKRVSRVSPREQGRLFPSNKSCTLTPDL